MSKYLHDEIMNIESKEGSWKGSLAYKCGHRDARHAAAELALSYIAGSAKGGNTSNNITQAAANKAAEEGGLPALKRLDALQDAANFAWAYGKDELANTLREIIAADRASRQVANKAEVEPVARLHISLNEDGLRAEIEVLDGEFLQVEHSPVDVYLAPPATTGASTAGLKRDAERHRYTRATTTAVRDPESGERIEVTPEMYDAAIDRAIADDPDFSKGIKSRHLVGASTVLMDERIIGMAKAACVDATRLSTVFDFARAIEREVAAQAGQVAVPESSRAAAYDAVAQALEGIYYCGRVWEAWNVGTMGKDDFTPAGEVDDVVNELVDAVISSISAPSPAKESK